jgi:hypothetical protein
MLRGLEPDIFSGIIEGALKVLDIPKGGGGINFSKFWSRRGLEFTSNLVFHHHVRYYIFERLTNSNVLESYLSMTFYNRVN